MIDELKTATSEISPAALINTATDSIQSLKKAVGFDDVPPHPAEQDDNRAPAQDQESESQNETSAEPSIERATSQLPSDIPESNTTQNDVAAPSASPAETPQAMTSPAKVQRMPSKKKKSAAPVAPAETEAEPSQEDLFNQLTSDTPTSPAKVTRAPSKKTPAAETTPATETEPSQEDLLNQLNDDEPSAAPTSPAKVVKAPSKKVTTEDSDAPSETSEATAEDLTDQNESDAIESSEETGVSSETPQEAKPSGNTKGAAPSAQKKPAPPAPSGAISKTEHAVRSFQALQTVLTNPIWAPIINDPEIKPSSLYAPRENFDTNFADTVFREGLKAASRLASSFGFEPEKMRFNPKVIEHVKGVDLDPDGQIKSYTQNISGAIGEEKVKEIMGIYHNKNFKHLLYSVSTRMGAFVPTIESVARIYLSLRKKEPLSSSDRLQIQEEILMRYRKAPYTDEMGKKARNLALNYFMDHLTTHTFKLYKDRFKDAPEGQNNIESHQRRHATIKSFCCDTIDDWAKKVAISSQAITSIQNKFIDLADQHLEEVLEDLPDDRKAY